MTPIFPGPIFPGLISRSEFPHPNVAETCQELLDTNLIRSIAFRFGLAESDLEGLQVVWAKRSSDSVELYRITASTRAFETLSENLSEYASGRFGGHSKAFLMECVTNQTKLSQIQDADMRIVATNKPWIPLNLLVKEEVTLRTNKVGQIKSILTITQDDGSGPGKTSITDVPKVEEVCRWVTFRAVDGPIGWRYLLECSPDGRSGKIDMGMRFDAKECDPKYESVIKEVSDEVTAEMKKKGTYGKLGSVHTFWRLKKEKLKARGIDWYSPRELNPQIRYD